MKEGVQIDRFHPIIPNPFMGEGYATSAAKGIYVLAKQSQSGYRNMKKPNEPKWTLATVKLQNKANFPFILSKMKMCKTKPIRSQYPFEQTNPNRPAPGISFPCRRESRLLQGKRAFIKRTQIVGEASVFHNIENDKTNPILSQL
jgi:hypothetical protein